jgi:hypothetical protein
VVSACSARFSVKWDCSTSTPFISGVLWVLRVSNVCIPKQNWAIGFSEADDGVFWEIWNDLETCTVFSSGRANLWCVQFVLLVLCIEMISIFAHCAVCMWFMKSNHLTIFFLENTPSRKKVGRKLVLILLQGLVCMPTTVRNSIRVTAWDGTLTQ